MSDWWHISDIDPSWAVGAYQAQWADSYENSKINLANPGVFDLLDGLTPPAWGADLGWTGDGASAYLKTGINPIDQDIKSIFVAWNNTEIADGGVVGEWATGAYYFDNTFPVSTRYIHGIRDGLFYTGVPG